MKRKIIFSLSSVIVLAGILWWLYFSFGFFTPYNFITARQDISNGKIQVIVYGKPFRPEETQLRAKKYGFEFSFLNCMVTKELINGTNKYNQEVEKYLDAKYGADFLNRFYYQLDSISKKDIIELK
ncbi:MAG: hypothetical protein WCH52_07295 [Bacteroidota bacterium]